jgi:CheY-like chemotaxis protein
MVGEPVWAIDDERNIRLMLSEFLSNNGYSPTCYDSCQAALDAIVKGEVEMPKAILCDIVMPGMDGVEFIRKAKQHLDGSCAYFFVTGHPGRIPEGPEFEDVAVYVKPMKMDELIDDLAKRVRGAGASE